MSARNAWGGVVNRSSTMTPRMRRKIPRVGWSQKTNTSRLRRRYLGRNRQITGWGIKQARVRILCCELDPPQYGVSVKTLQQLAALCVRWLTCNSAMFTVCRTIDLLHGHVGVSGVNISCEEVDIRMAFPNAMILTRAISQNDEDWGRFSRRQMCRMLTMR